MYVNDIIQNSITNVYVCAIDYNLTLQVMNCYDKVHNRLFMAHSDFFERFGMSYHILIIKHPIFPFTCIQRINNLLDQNRLNTNIDDSENSIPNTKYSFFMLSRFVSEMHLNE